MAPKKEKQYVSDNAQLMAEWDWEKNIKAGLNPQKLTYGSAIKAHWKCALGHEWEASPNHRSRGRQCPVCSNAMRSTTRAQNILERRGSLADINPILAKEWHPTKNGALTPADVSAGSGRKVWWQCVNGHEWKAVISSRSQGIGCAVCSGKRLLTGYNDLATVNPNLAAEWHPTKNGNLTPRDVTAHNDKKVWWLCNEGHEWQTAPTHRSNGTGCPICSGKKTLAGYNDLATINPGVAAQWHPTKNGILQPTDVVANSNKKVWWLCNKGHEWRSAIARRNKGTGCPTCFREAKTSFPEQAIFFYLRQVTTAINRYMLDRRTEIDIYLPEHKVGIEYDGAYFHQGEKSAQREARKQAALAKQNITLFRIKEAPHFHTAIATDQVIYIKSGPTETELAEAISKLFVAVNKSANLSLTADIDIARDRSKIYEQYIESEKENSLLVACPNVAAEWHPTKNGRMSPEYVTVSSNKKVWWQCEKGHEWQAVINSRSDGIGCPYCAGKKAIAGQTDLATVNPRLAAQWHPTKNDRLSPSDVTIFSNKTVWWQCEKGHEWKAMIYDRTNGCNCPICSGHKVLVGFNDLATVNPALALQWHPTKNGDLSPQDVTRGSSKKVWWICESGHEWEAVISSRDAGFGCPYCSNQKVLIGYNDLATTNPCLAVQWHPTRNGSLTPTDVTAGSNKKAWWICEKEHEWVAAISSRNNGNGCPYCAGQKVLAGYNDLATTNPKLANEWHPTKNGTIKPTNITAGSNKKYWWLCKNGHEWEISANIRNRGNNCPYCSNQKVLAGYNDLATTNPKLANEWHPHNNGNLKPSDVTAGANKKVWWICENGHEWEALISSRNQGTGCWLCHLAKRSSRIDEAELIL